MNIRNLKMFGLFVAFFLCFPMHFVYDLYPSFITSIFSPVNESIWEHMKLLFGSMIISGVIQKIIVIIKKENVKSICFSNFIGAICSIPVFLMIFLPIYYIFGHNLIVTIIIMFIALFIGQFISYIIILNYDFLLENVTIIFVVLVYMLFTYLSYYPIEIDLFRDPETNVYGISK